MKRLVIGALSAALLATAALAQEDVSAQAEGGDYMTTTEVCDTMRSIAESMMTVRQSGTPMGEILTRAEEMREDQFYTILVETIYRAYERSTYSTPEYQRRAVEDFASEMEVACYQVRRGMP